QPTLEAQKAASPDKDRPWTIVHGFYVAMGGLALDLPRDLPESEQFVPNWACGTCFIKPRGLELLLKTDKDRMPSMTEEEINSKSKANGLAKALVCAQALWFLATCVTRLAQRIPISLLELNTFGHAVCALFIYLLWWEKPFEVDIPTISAKRRALEDYPRREKDLFTSLDTVDIFNAVPNGLQFWRLWREFEFAPVQDPVKTSALQPDLNGQLGSTEYMPGEYIPDTGLKLKSTLEVDLSEASKISTALPSLKLTKQDINRWKMANRAANLIQGPSDRTIFFNDPFERRCTNMPDFIDALYELPLVYGFSAAAMVYGGLHALAWFAHFHSPTEQLLWRISSVVVMGGIPTLAVMFRVLDQLRDLDGSWLPDWALDLVFYSFLDLVFYSFVGLLFLIASAYVLARLYLVVECFIQLSHLPAGVYEEPAWSAYFPHIA
ncbi:MAG: hypothetical protein LQ349_008175, partial [Xanthoria aureola]